MKTYVLMIAENFPKTHSKACQPTFFIQQINSLNKLHTIRGNYEFWRKRFDKISQGKAILSVRIWVGIPYAKGSTNKEVFRFSNTDGIGLQKIDFSENHLYSVKIDDLYFDFHSENINGNDGLNFEDFEEWFKDYDLSKPLALIHFTSFRYS